MTAATLPITASLKLTAPRALDLTARLWFVTAAIGQGLFLAYILGLYALTTLSGDFAAWNRTDHLITGHVVGDTPGNLAFAAHMVLAAAVTFGGLIQLVQPIRTRWPAVHRWNGRIFLLTGAIASLTGLYMTWIRGSNLGLVGAIAITIDAAFILAFGWLAWRAARTRRFAAHRRWALRTFMVANAVWFLRVGIPPLGLLSVALTGSEPTISSPAFIAWNFGCYLLPLAILELYLRAKDGGDTAARWTMAAGLLAVTAVMAFGVAASWFVMFAPRLAIVS